MYRAILLFIDKRLKDFAEFLSNFLLRTLLPPLPFWLKEKKSMRVIFAEILSNTDSIRVV